ncbi:glycosyltransferase family 4 protein [Oricola thermophila]|uniref:Glycosyltransferase family 4 protein n=1 Tax=Oricola thermophila TaxID=2742145 RepID=A0A6N1VE02_9HYPH|nr:glycosyltransferase family 4 protein [Oricola thermophila]QKV19160.1 glycosyltransferase family 4 protein [Oricola thermophila]
MRIAQISPLYESVPPSLYGGTERVVSTLADTLVELGHDVTLFASGDSRTKARLVACRDKALRLDPARSWDLPAHLAMMEDVRSRIDSFDILHFHTDCFQMLLFEDVAARTVTTMHGRLDMKDLTPFLATHRRFPLVSVSDSQRTPCRFANFVATIPHGMKRDVIRPVESPSDDYVAFLGRISPEKGPDIAIDIARRAGWKIRIAAKVDTLDRGFYTETVEPLIKQGHVEFIGEIGDSQKSEFLGNARAVLFPIQWPEPFGLVMIEAMAAGTPVIAWPNGSVPEVIEDGVTGFHVTSVDDAVAAISRSAELDRARIRRTFERRFSDLAMAKAYVEVYEQLLAKARNRGKTSVRSSGMPAPHVAADVVKTDRANGKNTT